MIFSTRMNEREPVRFGVFEVDLGRRELRKHGLRLKLQGQPFQVLAALLDRPGELVTREELRLRIWGADTFVDFDQSLNRAVNKLREALGDSAENPRFIETMTRRGYRFLAPVTVATSNAPPPHVPPAVLRLTWARRLPAALVAVAVLCGAVFWMAHQPGITLEPKVVPLTTFTGEETLPAFSPSGDAVVFAWSGESATTRTSM
jgi:DNA-binding winged helix-turn-helix (wHTH) protein